MENFVSVLCIVVILSHGSLDIITISYIKS